MALIPKLLDAADGEWKRWGFSTSPLHGARTIVGTEKKAPYVSYVNDYWRAAGKPGWNGNTPQPWSAAFISFCFKTAGAGAGFPYATGHVDYRRAIVNSPAKYPGLGLADPAVTALAVGDLVWAARRGTDCPTPPLTHAAAIGGLKAGSWFCSHCDIVVEVRPGEVDVIGGNVSDSVIRTTYATASDRIKDGRHVWLAIVNNSM